MRVRDFRRRLEEMSRASGRMDAELARFLRILADLDDMDFAAFLRLVRPKSGTQTMTGSGRSSPPLEIEATIQQLRSAFDDDEAFHAAITNLRRQRSITKAALSKIFLGLFERSRGVPSRATREELLQLIADERNTIVRNEKMGKLLGRRAIPAE